MAPTPLTADDEVFEVGKAYGRSDRWASARCLKIFPSGALLMVDFTGIIFTIPADQTGHWTQVPF
jgi:hypothetical protein